MLFNIFDSNYLAGPLFGWILSKAVWSMIVPAIMGRDLTNIAPSAPGRFKSLFLAILSAIGFADYYMIEDYINI